MITVSAGAVAALVVGFVIGYCCGRKCGKESNVHLPYPDTEYEYFEQRQGLARPMAPLLPTSSDKVDPRDQEEVVIIIVDQHQFHFLLSYLISNCS